MHSGGSRQWGLKENEIQRFDFMVGHKQLLLLLFSFILRQTIYFE